MRILLAITLSLSISFVWGDEPVDFNKDIAPLLARNCSACHNLKKPEGGLVLESYTTLMKGGDSGAAVVPNELDKSELLARIVATDDAAMPPANNSVGAKRLTEVEVALVKAWIKAGAVAPKDSVAQTMNWRDITNSLKPIYASDLSPDGRYLAYGIGNTLALVTDPFGSVTPNVQSLLDPGLKLASGQAVRASHLDLVQSVAFSPDSQRIASGDFRTVKIWKRQTTGTQLATTWPENSRVLAVNSQGNRLAIATADHQLWICEPDTAKPLTKLKGHGETIVAAAWVPESQLMFSCDASGRLLRWNLPAELAAEIAYVDAPQSAEPNPNVVRISADSKEVKALAACNAESVLLLHSNNKVMLLQQAAVDANAPSASFAPVPTWDRFENVSSISTAKPAEAWQYVVANAAGVLEILGASGSEPAHKIEQGAPVVALAVSRDGKRLSVSGANAQTKTWNLTDGKQVATWQGDYDHLRALQAAERNVARQKAFVDLLAARIPELKKEAEKEVEARKKVEEARTKAVEAVAAKAKEVEAAKAAVTATQTALEETRKAIEEANKRMATLTTEMETKQKAVAEAEKNKTNAEAEVPKHDQALATATEGVERANGLIPKQEQMVASETMVLTTAQQALETLKAVTPPVANAIAFDSTGSQVIAAAADQSLHLFDANTGKPVAKLSGAALPYSFVAVTDQQHVVAKANEQLFTWDLALNWQLERVLGAPDASLFSDRITALDFSPDGQLLAIGSGPPSRYGDVKLINLATGEVQRDMGEVHSDTVLGIRFSPDGRQLATVGADKLCRLFTLGTETPARSFEGHTHHVLAVAWQNDGQTLATASADNSLKTWSIATGERKQSIAGYGKEVTAVDFVGQSDQILSCSVDGQVKLHNASNAQQVRVFAGANSPLYTLTCSPDGQYVVAGGQSGTIWIWQVSDAKLLRKLPE